MSKFIQQTVLIGPKKEDLKKQGATNLMACRKKISCGHFAAAIRVLSSSGVAACIEVTYHDFQDKHPSAPPPDVLGVGEMFYPITVDPHAVLGAIKSFPKGTS